MAAAGILAGVSPALVSYSCVLRTVALAVLLAGSTSHASYAQTILSTPGLVSYWRFGEASGTVSVDEAGVRDGVYSGSPTLGAPGAIFGDADTSVRFNPAATQYISVPHVAAHALTSGFTLEIWAYFFGYADSSLSRAVIEKGRSISGRNYGLHLPAPTANPGMLDGNFGSGSTYINARRATNLPLNQWLHLAVVHEAGVRLSLYINGELEDEQLVVSPANVTTQAMSIGGYSLPGYTVDARLDELALYSVPLSQQTLRAHYYEGQGRPDTQIVSAPPSPTQMSAVEFAFTGSATASSFECRLDQAMWTACTSPHTYPAVTEGLHVFEVRALNSVLLPDPTPASHTFVVEPTAPDGGTTEDAGSSTDGGNTAPGDAGLPADASEQEPGRLGVGCGCASGSSFPGALAAALVGLVLRRTRSQRARSCGAPGKARAPGGTTS